MQEILAFDTIESNYDLFLIDIWGVVHDGFKPYNGTIEKLNQLLEKKIVKFVSNAPRPNHIVCESLKKHGLNVSIENIVTSGDITREFLQNIASDKKIYHLGAVRNEDILKDLNIETVNSLEEADMLLMTPYLDQGEDLNQYDHLLAKAKNLNLIALCANPDVEVLNGNSIRYCAGYFAKKYRDMNGKVKYFGKPDKDIYDYVFNQYRNIAKNKILMIGDTHYTDIKGAADSSIDSALVMTGNMGNYLKDHAAETTERKIQCINDLFAQLEYKPTHLILGIF